MKVEVRFGMEGDVIGEEVRVAREEKIKEVKGGEVKRIWCWKVCIGRIGKVGEGC